MIFGRPFLFDTFLSFFIFLSAWEPLNSVPYVVLALLLRASGSAISSNFVYPDLVFGLPPDDQHLQVQLHCKTTSLVTWLVAPFGLVSTNRLVTRQVTHVGVSPNHFVQFRLPGFGIRAASRRPASPGRAANSHISHTAHRVYTLFFCVRDSPHAHPTLM